VLELMQLICTALNKLVFLFNGTLNAMTTAIFTTLEAGYNNT